MEAVYHITGSPRTVFFLAVFTFLSVGSLAILGTLAYSKSTRNDVDIQKLQQDAHEHKVMSDSAVIYIHATFDSMYANIRSNTATLKRLEKK